ncbi:hypothetical protein [Sporolactobacillus pectinivorans]|uniref:hypothetical protein n=1 Tax=Sporolactobacillus pectinivorans TaxID=1591408 RepID=UPI000C266706|nr:hypothetical protein [Sporolactobacillus pectinivorans]
MAEGIEYKQYSRHFATLIGYPELNSLTAQQLDLIAVLMESQYRSGVHDSKTLSDLSVRVNFEGIEKVVKQAIDKEFKNLSRLYKPEIY